MSPIALESYLSGRWQRGEGTETTLIDPVSGAAVATASARGLDLAAALAHARHRGGSALRAMTYGQRAGLLGGLAEVLAGHRARYEAIALANSGNTRVDAAIDIDGGIGTLKYYARLGGGLGDARALLDQGPVRLAKAENFQAIHMLTPRRGVALHINAFNFPSWGLWEKAAVSLLSGVPVMAKPASATAWLAYEMVRDVIAAQVLPEGALSLICGGVGDLFAHLTAEDVIAFTGSHDTAMRICGDPALMRRSVPVNIEADSINSALLAPDADAGTAAFDAFVAEVAREMTVKAGQKCTAIRRVFVPTAQAGNAAEALVARLAKTVVGDPRREDVRMGPVVTPTQKKAVLEAIGQVAQDSDVLCGGAAAAIEGVDQDRSAFVAPTLLQARDAAAASIHDVEVFGPAATLIPYRGSDEAFALIRRGGGSLVASVYGSDASFLATAARELGSAHGRILLVDPSIAKSHTGHGIVMPQCHHGGPGRAGNGAELGGLNGLRLYHQRVAVQGSTDSLALLQAETAPMQ
jgi:3,4-dehydroadipyl-CoA semialdehyde dehydrogenase